MLDQEKLEKLLSQKDSEKKIVQFFQGVSEQERKKLSGFCIENLKRRLKAERDAWSSRDYRSDHHVKEAAYAAYCTSTPSQFDLGRRAQIDGDLVCKLLADRRPDWMDDWVQRCCQQLRVLNYPDIRRLILGGLCRAPDDDNFVRMMIDSIDREFKTPLDGLRKDPQLLEDLVWRVFEVPYVTQGAAQIGYLRNTWADAFATLSKQGKMDRRRLFESCFSATHMGFNREQVKVFLYLHDALKPTLQERQGMFDSYCGLIESNLPAVVTFAFETLQQLDKDKPQDEQCLCEVLRSTMRSPTKSMVKATLKWLDNLTQRNAGCATSACLAALEGLLHEKPDVQADSWRFIERHATVPSEALIDGLMRVADSTSASVRKQIKLWHAEHSAVGSEPPADANDSDSNLDEAIALAKKTDKRLAKLLGLPQLLAAIKANARRIPPCTFDGTEISRLHHREELKPIGSMEALVEVASRVLEDGNLVDEAELVLEALTRFPVAGDAAALKTADPIIKRARKKGARSVAFYGAGADHDLVPVIEAWSGDEKRFDELKQEYDERDDGDHLPPGLTGFLGYRSRAVMNRFMENQPLRLLAAPTHAGGWIDPLVLARRLKEVKDAKHLLDYDQILALLRLAPDNRSKARKACQDVAGEFAAAFRYACGEPTRKIGKTYYLWIAAARARCPFDSDPLVEKKFPDLGADAALAAKYQVRDSGRKKKRQWDVTTLLYAEDSPLPKFDHKGWENSPDADYLLPTTLPHEHSVHSSVSWDWQPCEPKVLDLAASVWPIARESYYLPNAFVKPLFDFNAPLLEMSTRGLVRALGDHWQPYRAMGVDLAIAAIEDGRWDSARVGRMLALEIYFAQRFTKTLSEVAAASPLHTFQVSQSLIEMLAQRPTNRPAGFAGLLELLYELLEELQLNLDSADAVEFLKSLTGSSKAAKCAKRLVQFHPDSQTNLTAIYEQSIRGRLAADRRIAKP